jgi:hypothetical protein
MPKTSVPYIKRPQIIKISQINNQKITIKIKTT